MLFFSSRLDSNKIRSRMNITTEVPMEDSKSYYNYQINNLTKIEQLTANVN